MKKTFYCLVGSMSLFVYINSVITLYKNPNDVVNTIWVLVWGFFLMVNLKSLFNIK